MPKIERRDEPDSWHHVTNRGLARRVLFEDAREMRAFLALLATVVRRRQLRVHAFCVMATHYHLLVESPREQLSDALRTLQLTYVRWFNRRHRRDGPLFRGRFTSRPVATEEYRLAVVRYVDHNPVRAGIVRRACDYRYGSASRFLASRRCVWLSRDYVAAAAGVPVGDPEFPRRYDAVFGRPVDGADLDQIEQERDADRRVFFADAPAEVRAWMIRKARLADGTRPGRQVLSVEAARAARARGEIGCGGGAEGHLWVMVLRDLCALPLRQLARELGVSVSTAHRRVAQHRDAMLRDSAYAAAAAALAQGLVRQHAAGRSG